MKNFNVKVEVKLKPVVLDPQGKAILSALHNLGYKEVSQTRIGKLIELKIEGKNAKTAEEKTHEMCKKLLSNPVIEDYFISISEDQNA